MRRVQCWGLRFLLVVFLAVFTSLSLAADAERGQTPSMPDEMAPEAFAVLFETSKGAFVVEAYRSWAPRAADRFYHLVTSGYYDGNVFFHVDLAQSVKFGVHSDPEMTRAWAPHSFRMDPPRRRIRTGDLFMMSGNSWLSSATQAGIQVGPDGTLASRAGVTPFGRVVEGLEILETLDNSHMRKPRKHGKMIRQLLKDGEKKVRKKYPNIDSISKASLLDRSVEVPQGSFPESEALPADLPPGEGLVRLYRPAFQSRLQQNFNLRVDGRLRAALKPGNLFEISLPAGKHEISGKVKFKMFASGLLDQAMASRSKYVIDVEPGKVQYLRATAAGVNGRVLLLRVVSVDLGEEESRGLAPAKEKTGAERGPEEEGEDEDSIAGD